MGAFTGTPGRWRLAVAGLAAGVVVGGTVAVVAPAVATQDTSYAATNWKKIWKKQLQKYADKRYYTKAQSDAKYSTKAETAAGLGNVYTKAQGDAKYAAAGSSYSKAESDAKYAPYPSTLRGIYVAQDVAGAAGNTTFAEISFGFTLPAAPTPVFIPLGGSNPNCPGTYNAPGAAPGFLCLWEGGEQNYSGPAFFNPFNGGASAMGATLRISADAAGSYGSWGRWAVTRTGAFTTNGTPSAGSPGGATALQ